MKKDNYFLIGMKDSIPVGLGYLAVSFAFGMNICQSGYPVWLAGLISFTNLTSAGQFAGTSLILQKATYIEIILTTLIINLRYFLMSLSLSQHFDDSMTFPKRLIIAHATTDEIFAIGVSRKFMINSSYMFGIMIMPIVGWTTGTVLGGVFANILPHIIIDSLGIALYAMFFAIIIPPAKKSKPILFTVILAAAISACFTYIPIFEFVSSGWGIIIITVLVSAISATLFPIDKIKRKRIFPLRRRKKEDATC